MGIVQSQMRARRLEEGVRMGRVDAELIAQKLEKHPELLRTRPLAANHCLLHVAAAAANVDVLATLLACADGTGARGVVNARNARGQTPLMLAAAAAGGADCVCLLLAAGADPWAADCCGGRTALFYAACADEADSAAALLAATDGATLVSRAFPNAVGTRYVDMRMLAGFTPLHVAVIADARAALRTLLRAGARLSLPTLFASYDFIPCARATCALHLAARHNRAAAAKMILLAHAEQSHSGAHAVDPRVLLDDLNRQPCQLAAISGHADLANLLQPGAPLAEGLGASGEDLYLAGPPPLKLLAAAALRAHQQATLAAARRALGLEPGSGPRRKAALAARPAAAPPCLPGGGRACSATACGASRPDSISGCYLMAEALAFEMARATPPSGSVLQARCDAEAAAEIEAAAIAAAVAASAAEHGSCAGDDEPACCGASCWGEWEPEAGPAEGDDEIGAADDECCGVCLDAAADVRLQPCGHTLCAECCGQLFGMRHAEVVACPFCRRDVGAFRPACR